MAGGGGEERALTIHKIQSTASCSKEYNLYMHKTQPKLQKQQTCFQKLYTIINATSTIYRHSMEKLINFKIKFIKLNPTSVSRIFSVTAVNISDYIKNILSKNLKICYNFRT